MKRSRLARYALTICTAAALLAGCGGSQPPTGAPGAMQQSSAIATHASHGGSWMLPEAKSDDLLYVSNGGTNTVTVYTWGYQHQVGTLTGFEAPRGLCADRNGDVFVTNSRTSQIFEYEHGGTSPINALSDPYGSPTACAVDPTTGDLAASNTSPGSAPSSVLVYRDASGTPTQYADASVSLFYYPAYDNEGNLYVDGVGPSSPFQLVELPKGGSTLTSVTLDDTPPFAGGLAWDGEYLALGFGSGPTAIHQFSMSGSSGRLEGSTTLSGSDWVLEFAVPKLFGNGKVNPRGKRLIGADLPGNDVAYWIYPAGGYPVKGTSGGISSPEGIAVSRAPH